jgi:hypothetical protein
MVATERRFGENKAEFLNSPELVKRMKTKSINKKGYLLFGILISIIAIYFTRRKNINERFSRQNGQKNKKLYQGKQKEMVTQRQLKLLNLRKLREWTTACL